MRVTVSPLQMKQMLYTKIFVEPHMTNNTEELWAPAFDFEGVEIKTEIKIALADGQEDDPKDFRLNLELAILNADSDKKCAPYTLHFGADAWFEVSSQFKVEEREKLVLINGASMMIGAIREQISQLTARSVYGPMILPSLRILSEAEVEPDSATEDKKS